MDLVDLEGLDFLDVEVGKEAEVVREVVQDGIWAGAGSLLVVLAGEEFARDDRLVKGGLICEHHAMGLAKLHSAAQHAGAVDFVEVEEHDAGIHVVAAKEAMVMVEPAAVEVEDAGRFDAGEVEAVEVAGVGAGDDVVVEVEDALEAFELWYAVGVEAQHRAGREIRPHVFAGKVANEDVGGVDELDKTFAVLVFNQTVQKSGRFLWERYGGLIGNGHDVDAERLLDVLHERQKRN